MCRFTILFLIWSFPLRAFAQYPVEISYQAFKFGITPGIGTSGANAAAAYHSLSLNVLSGLSAGNRGLELSLFSSYTSYETRGFQISGVSNVAGGMIKKVVKRSAKENNEKTFSLDFVGMQAAGVCNVVGGTMMGLQVSGGWNFSKENMVGVQASGLYNGVIGSSFGLQFSGVLNVSRKTMDGTQLSVISNITDELNGLQIAAINHANHVNLLVGKSGLKLRSIQIGLLNTSQSNYGLQIGLINYATTFSGYQIGLINICSKQKGIPIGLVNLNSTGGHARIYASELFLQNYEFTTGSEKIQNFLTYSFVGTQPGTMSQMISYGIGKVYYKAPANRTYKSLEMHYGKPMEGSRLMDNGLLSLKFGAGQVVHAGKFVFYPHAALTLNVEHYTTTSINSSIPSIEPLKDSKLKLWAGLNLGLHFH